MATVRPRHRNSIALQHVNRGEGGGKEKRSRCIHTRLHCSAYFICAFVKLFPFLTDNIALSVSGQFRNCRHRHTAALYSYINIIRTAGRRVGDDVGGGGGGGGEKGERNGAAGEGARAHTLRHSNRIPNFPRGLSRG